MEKRFPSPFWFAGSLLVECEATAMARRKTLRIVLMEVGAWGIWFAMTGCVCCRGESMIGGWEMKAPVPFDFSVVGW